MTRSRVLGVTGVSGSGTTTVARILQRHGAFVATADTLAHEAILRGNPPYEKVIAAFGEGVLNNEGEVDRKKLGGIVLGSPPLLKILEEIIHPYVTARIYELINTALATGEYGLAVIDAPLLIEAGMNRQCGRVWLVTAPYEIKISRIIKRDGITREAAEKRLAARDEVLLAQSADEVISNDGSMEKLEDDVIKKLNAL